MASNPKWNWRQIFYEVIQIVSLFLCCWGLIWLQTITSEATYVYSRYRYLTELFLTHNLTIFHDCKILLFTLFFSISIEFFLHLNLPPVSPPESLLPEDRRPWGRRGGAPVVWGRCKLRPLVVRHLRSPHLHSASPVLLWVIICLGHETTKVMSWRRVPSLSNFPMVN